MQQAALSPTDILKENEELRVRLAEAEDMLRAIRGGDVNALVVESDTGPQVYALQGQDAEASRLRGEMLEKVSEAIIAVDESGLVTFFNAAAEGLYGLSASKALARPLAEIFSTRWLRPGDETTAAAALRKHNEWYGETVHVRRDGHELHVEASITRFKGKDGRETGRLALIRDVSERRQQEKRVLVSETRYRRLFEAAHDGILILDPATRKIVDANPFMTALTGYPHEQLIGLELYQIGFLADAQASQDIFQALKTTRQVRYENLPLQTNQGGLRDVEVVANLYDEGGHSVVQCNVRDITERKAAEAALDKNDKRQAFLLKLSDTLRPLGDPLEVQTAALRVLGEHLAVNRAFYNEIDEEQDAYVIHKTYANGVAPLTGHFRLSDIRRTAELAGSGQIVVIDDASADPRLSAAERAAFAAMEMASGIGVPFIKDGRWVAGLGVHHVTLRQWTPEEIDLIRETAERTWAAVEQAQAETALQSGAARDAFRVRLTDALRRAANAEEAQEAAMRVLGDHFQASRVMFGEGDEGSTETFTNHRDYLRAPAMPSSVGQHRWDDFGPYVKTEFLAGRTLAVDDVQTHPEHSPEQLAAYEMVGIKAYLAVPLVRQKRIIAYLAVNHTTAHTWTPHEIALAEETAERIWATVERARAEAALAKSDNRFRMAILNSPITVFEQDLDLRYTWIYNPKLGFDNTSTLGKTDADPLDPAVVERLDVVKHRALETGQHSRQEVTVELPGNGLNHFELSVEPRRGPDGQINGIICTSIDITERRRAETELRERQNFLDAIFNVMPGVLYIFDLDESRVVFVNNTAALTYSTEEIASMGADMVPNLMHPDDQQGFHEHIARIRTLSPGATATFEYRMRDKAGEWRWYMSTDTVFLRDENGVVRQFIGVAPEITDRKRAELALRDSEARQHQVLEASQIGTFDVDLVSGETNWNSTEFKLLGLQPGEAPSGPETFFRHVHPEDLVGAKASWETALQSGTLDTEFRIIRADREVRWLVARGNVSYDQTNDNPRRARRYIGVNFDNTERKNAEAAMQASEHRYRTLIEVTSAVSWSCAPSGLQVEPQPQWMAFTGQSAAEMLGTGYARAFHPDDAENAAARWVDAVSRAEPYSSEHRIRRHDGEWRWMRVSSAPVHQNGGIAEWFGMAVDITERKEAAAALHDSETRLSRILNQSPAGIVQTDASGRMVVVNERWCEMLGYSESEMLGMTVIDVTHPSSVEATLESVGRLARGGPDFQIDKNYRRKDGTMLQVNSNVAALRDAQGNFQGLLAVVLDMTKRLEIEERLRDNVQRIALAAETTGLGIWEWNIHSNKILWDAQMFRIYGLPPTDDGFVSNETWRSAVHPEDMARMKGVLEDTIQSNARGSREFRILRADTGEYRTIHAVDAMRAHAEGKSEWMVGTNLDITERKRQEEHIQLLMGEVNHRSKNMLSLVQAIAKRTVAGHPGDFIERFGQRVQALAANQDLLNRSEWKAVPVGDLVRSHLAHFGDAHDTRVALDGPPVEITPSASQALGMALHELATNAAKYGALSNEVGRVAISWNLRSDASGKPRFTMSWAESGGPPVVKPTRQGFGSTVTGTMINMSLGCDAEVDFAPTGFVWRIDCPAASMVEGSVRPAPQWNGAAAAEEPAQASGRPRVLVVEDEPLIAMDIAHTLAEAGYDVIGPAHSVAIALALIAQSGCDAAVLDINLGAETAEPVARELFRRGTPFITTSGYMREQQPEIMRTAPLLGKPLKPELLTAEIARCLGS